MLTIRCGIMILLVAILSGLLITDAPEPASLDSEWFVIEPEHATYGSVQVSAVTNIYDGDTFNVDVDDWPPIIGMNVSVRVYGVDTPELTDHRAHIKKLAFKARAFTNNFLTTARVVELRNLRRDKYFRLNAEVYADGCNLADALIDAGLGKSYYGGAKSAWTASDVR